MMVASFFFLTNPKCVPPTLSSIKQAFWSFVFFPPKFPSGFAVAVILEECGETKSRIYRWVWGSTYLLLAGARYWYCVVFFFL